MVTPKVNYNYLVIDRPTFHNIVSQSKIDEYVHAMVDYHGNYVYEKINTERTVVKIKWEDNKNDIEIHPSEWFGSVFPVCKYQQIPDKFLPLQKLVW